MTELTGRSAVVTGAAAGIGAAVALDLAARGAIVLAVDRDPAVLALSARLAGPTDSARLAGPIDPVRLAGPTDPAEPEPGPTGPAEPEPGSVDLDAPVDPAAPAGIGGCGRITGVVVDLADAAELTALAERVASAPGPDILVNCAAAYPPDGGFLAADIPAWTRLLQVNVTALGVLSAAMARARQAAGLGGVIVNFGSVQEELPVPGFGPYVASKGAIRAATRALAVELAPLGIRVNAVTPGVIESPSTTATLGGQAWAASAEVPPTLLARAGTPGEVAEVVAFLVSDAASFMTGAVLPVDGGRSLSRRPDPLGRR